MKELVQLLAITSTLAEAVSAKAVFAHYMVGGISQAHVEQDIDTAKAMGLDAFALNIGDATQEYVSTNLANLFPYAESVGFKLFVSMDVDASGNACSSSGTSCNGPYDYQWVWDSYKGSSAYYLVNDLPLISTFSSGGFLIDEWTSWKSGLANDMFFMPDFDETDGYYDAADGWWSYWGSLVDGIFSWESTWPETGSSGDQYAGDVSLDVPVLAGAKNNDKQYMIGLSPLQYKNAYGGNWYRLGDLNLPRRMENILSMDPQPDFVEIMTWNDGPESHYIGGIWSEANGDDAPALYATEAKWSHQGWQSLVASFTTAFKNSKAATEMAPADGSVAVGAAWYHTILSTASCTGDEPDGWSKDDNELYWAVVLNPTAASGYTATITSGSGATTTATLQAGLNYGSSTGGVQAGAQKITVKDSAGNVVYSATGGYCVSSGCPNNIYNGNYQVLPLAEGDADATCTEL